MPVLVLAYLAVTFVQVWDASTQRSDSGAGAVVVLGAAQYNGRPSPVLRKRLDHALALYRKRRAPVVVLTGAKRSGDRFTEAYAGFQYLRARDVPEGDLVIVDDGTSTWESLAASGRVLRERGIREVILVSDPYHSFRLDGIAEEVGLRAELSPADTPSSFGRLLRETAVVSVGRIIGYRRVTELLGS